MNLIDCLVVGGGAAGFFAALRHQSLYPEHKVMILEKSKNVLAKVRISGGGRCNVTHHCKNPKELVKNYPRGAKELLGPFFSFNPEHTIEWFEQRGVQLKTEKDGRIFPVSDDSMSIVHCFLEEAQKLGVKIQKQSSVKECQYHAPNWEVKTIEETFYTKKLILATGSSAEVWKWLQNLSVATVKPVPSLFTFRCIDDRIQHLAGITLPMVRLSIPNTKLQSDGPLLLTHRGFSGPAILKLSAWGARTLYDLNYTFNLHIQFHDTYIPFSEWITIRTTLAKKLVKNTPLYNIPARLWENIVHLLGEKRWGDLKNIELEQIHACVFQSCWEIEGKDTFQEEFVTAGGIDLKEIHWKTMALKHHTGLFAAGEVLDIDGITGGFNFQAAWTTAWLAGSSPI